MSLPIYELNGEEVVDFPWEKENLRKWLYRPIRVTGRPMHYKTMMIPEEVHEYRGYAYVVPLVTRENEDSSE
jgi:surfeit locus 1 family protein